MKNSLNKKIEWCRVASRGRNHAILMIDAVGVAGQKDYTRRIYSFTYKVDYYRQFDGSRWISEKDHLTLNRLFELTIKRNPKFLYQIGLKIEKVGLKILALVDKNKNRNWTKLSNRELSSVLGKFQDLVGKLWWGGPCLYGWYFFFNDIYLNNLKNILEKKLKNDFEGVWNYLIQTERVTFIGQEKLALLRLAKRFIKSKNIPEKYIKDHLRQFAFVNKYYWWGEGLTYRQVKDELKKIIRNGEENIKKEMSAFQILKLDLNKFPLSTSEKWIIKGLKKMGYVFNFCDEASNYYTYNLKLLVDEIARRLKISYEECASMRFQEIKESLENNRLLIPRKELKERYKDHALIFAKNNVYVISGKDLKKYQKEELKEEAQADVKEFKGVVAFKSEELIRSKVMIIKTNEQVSSFKKGWILVTHMTNPTYLPAMKKAKAVITDEGGLLCHAAIVSRELKIPCIIGTKIATQVLKDGDLVEVDANKGVVRVLKRE